MGNNKVKNLQGQNAELQKRLGVATLDRDSWRDAARARYEALEESEKLGRERGKQLDQERTKHRETSEELQALKAQLDREAREAHLEELEEGILQLGDAQVTVSKTTNGATRLTAELELDSDELRAVEAFLKTQEKPKWDAFNPHVFLPNDTWQAMARRLLSHA